jgi:hypothetical protein
MVFRREPATLWKTIILPMAVTVRHLKTNKSTFPMNTTNDFSEAKLNAQSVTPEHLSESFLDACDCLITGEPLNQELEYLWDDEGPSGNTYGIYLGKISRNPIVKSKITGKYFMLPWSVIIKLAAEKGINH